MSLKIVLESCMTVNPDLRDYNFCCLQTLNVFISEEVRVKLIFIFTSHIKKYFKSNSTKKEDENNLKKNSNWNYSYVAGTAFPSGAHKFLVGFVLLDL